MRKEAYKEGRREGLRKERKGGQWRCMYHLGKPKEGRQKGRKESEGRRELQCLSVCGPAGRPLGEDGKEKRGNGKPREEKGDIESEVRERRKDVKKKKERGWENCVCGTRRKK